MQTTVILMAAALLAMAGTPVAAEPATAAQHKSFTEIAKSVRQAYEQNESIPRDPNLYGETVSYGHGYDDPRTLPTKSLLDGSGREIEAMKKATDDFKISLVRFLTSGNTIVAVTRATAKLKDGSSFRGDAASFLTVEKGRITHIQTWPDRLQWTPMMKYLKPQAPAASQ